MFYQSLVGHREGDAAVASWSVCARQEWHTYIGIDKLVDRREDILVSADILQGIWAIFFHPNISTSLDSPQCSSSPRQVILSFHWQISRQSLGLPTAFVGAELDRVLGGRDVDVHFVLVV